jgi:two-component sensor histidine kinase
VSCYRLLQQALPPDDVVEAVDHLHLEPVPRVVHTAREFVREHLPPVSENLLDTVLLLTSELVTNAVIHARTAIEVGITLSDRSVLITVHDEDLGKPSQSYAGRDGGRGLGLVAALAEATDTERHPGEGKTVWFRVARDGGVST